MNLENNFFVQLYGKPRSGKSHTMKYIIRNAIKDKKISDVVIFTPTSFTSGYDYIDKNKCVDYSDEALMYILNLQREKVELQKQESPLLICFDDCLGNVNWNKSILKEFFCTYRHYNLALIVTSQYIHAIPSYIREFATHACIFRQETTNSINAGFENFGASYFTLDEFTALLNKATGDFKYLFVDKTQYTKESIFSSMRTPKDFTKFYISSSSSE
jgi:hypothetical protein